MSGVHNMIRDKIYISDNDLQALVDGAFGTDDHARILSRVNAHPAMNARFEYLCGQKILLQAWWESLPEI